MVKRDNKKSKHLSLKEASKISGYSSDYIGQLIREGKISGKQVYTAVSWVTTEEALKEYMEKTQKSKKERGVGEKAVDKLQQTGRRIMLDIKMAKFFKGALYASIGFLTAFILFLFYVASVSIDHKLEQNAVNKAQINTNIEENTNAPQSL